MVVTSGGFLEPAPGWMEEAPVMLCDGEGVVEWYRRSCKRIHLKSPGSFCWTGTLDAFRSSYT
jgi:hypothetical protein